MQRFGDDWTPFKKLIYISIVFLVMFTAFNSIQNLASQIYEQNGYASLGKICLFTFYASFSTASFISSKIVEQFGVCKCLLVSCFPYLLAYISGIGMCLCTNSETAPGYCNSQLFIFAFHIISYLLIGIASSVLWSAFSGYMTALASKSETGRYFGYFFAIVQNSFIIGGFLPSIIFRYASTLAYFVIMLILAACAAVLFYVLPEPKPSNIDSETLSPILGNQASQTIKKPFHFSTFLTEMIPEMKRVLDLRQNNAIKPWLKVAILSGFIVSYNFGFIYRFVEISLPSDTEPSIIVAMTAQMFIVFGIAMVVSAFIVGKAIDHFGTRKVTRAIFQIFALMMILSFLQLYLRIYPLACVISALGGTLDVCITTLISSIMTLDFGGSLEYFALYRAFYIFGTAAGFIILIIVSGVPLVIIIAALAGFGGYVWTQIRDEQTRRKSSHRVAL